jgi:penicillin-binding protein 2
MFERRLKIFLAIVLGVMSVLLLRAIHLQIFTRGEWVKAAEDFKKKASYIETTRGRLLDHKGHEIAVDEACIDACVDYRAISRDEKWIREVATIRAVADHPGDEWKKLDKKLRPVEIEKHVAGVKADIARMFLVLAKETGQSEASIDEICHQINLRVAMRTRMRQYRRFRDANREREDRGDAPWYRKWLIEGGKDGPEVDDFDEIDGEEVGVHPIVRNLSPDAYLKLAREVPRCPGLVLQPGTHRKYPYQRAAAHLMGYLTPVMQEDIKADPNLGDPLRGLQFADLIGRSGLEALCEPTLRGVRGKAYRRVGEGSPEIAQAPVPGRDVRTTIDIDLQDQIRTFFENMPVKSNLADDKRVFTLSMHGAAVVIDVQTSAVRALASYPDYDPNTLTEDYETFINGSEIDKLNAPLLNRATQACVVPGSTIKPVVGLSGVTAHVNVPSVGELTVQRGIECTGFLVLNGHKLPNGRCWVASKFSDVLHGAVAHHPVPWNAPHRGQFGNPDGFLCLTDALERSCNVYFETVADAFGADALSDWYEKFGLGRETGIGVSEACGMLPRNAPRQDRSTTYFSGIGQSGVEVTPLQMANVAATIARDGVWMRPRLVEDDAAVLKPIPPRDGRRIPDRVDLHLDPGALAAAKEGMIKVVNGPAGTGSDARMDEFLVAGKTGTAQASKMAYVLTDDAGNPILNEKGKKQMRLLEIASADHETSTPWYRGGGEDRKSLNHAWFVGFAPAERPQIAIAVMVQYGGSGGSTAAQTAKKILMACVEHGYITPNRK